ncbi:MAG TPA: molecular chaperone TorD family protein [Candidatus Kapabacteria bacterium]|jgi:TorA maturation chaperone TorD|nr:molecular chaperone TorD family protein [Candidatus Kapabacteria bacterium]
MMQHSIERAGLYRFFAAIFRYPSPEEWRTIVEGLASARAAHAVLGVATTDFDELARAIRATTREEIEPAYVRTFVNGLPSIVAAPYESSYAPAERRLEVLAAVDAFYERCGVRVSGDGEGHGPDMPDHIATELELMQYLAAEEHDSAQFAAVVASIAAEFLETHLAPFVRALTDEVRDGLHHHALRALATYLDAELRRLS